MSGVVSDRVLRRLRWHAGLEKGADPSITSISACTWPAAGLAERLDEAVADFLNALEELNRELNGPVPSESCQHADAVPIDVAYAISEVTRQLREYAATQERVAPSGARSREAWLLETAWNAILAGDIDDLREHLSHEESARAG